MTYLPKFALSCALVALTGVAHAATFTGQSVNGTITSPGGAFTTIVPFTSPAIVGPGIEFTSNSTDVFNQVWNVTADFSATALTIKFLTPASVNGNISNGTGVVDLAFSGFSGVTPLAFKSYNCTPAGFACSTFSGGPNSTIVTSTASAFDVKFGVLRTGETYVFGVVPEPASWALMLVGFGLVGIALRRRQPARVSFA
jgi:hypothetical protein